MSDFHNTHYVEFFSKSHFSVPVFVAVNCATFDALSRLSSHDTDLCFATNHCFICLSPVHRVESCPKRSLGMLLCRQLDDLHSKFFIF
jgi:hypothetical protein